MQSDGTFSVDVAPTETMQYRLASGTVKSAVSAGGGRGRMRRLAIALATLALALPAAAAGSATFAPNDPLAVRQWYLNAIHAFDFWPEDPVDDLAPVRVAIIDSGIDLDHPEFAGRILNEQSFVGGDVTDRQGHGTFVAGIIAATPNNGAGIAGIAFPPSC